jgi:hypothetical protein
MADLRTEAGVELAGDALFVYLDRLGLDPAMIRPYAAAAAVMDTLKADSWVRLDPNEPHLIEFRAGGWTIQHPLRCRPNLFACAVNRVGEQLPGPPQRGIGVYECDLQDGVLVVGRQIEAGGADAE